MHPHLDHSPGHSGTNLRVLPAAAPPCTQRQRDADFVALQQAYRSTGGIGCGESMALRMSISGNGGYVDLARRIVAGKLFSFQWHDQFWLPLFQFDPLLLTQREAPRRVLDELHGALDGWAIAHWYVAPNTRLAGQRPLDLLDADLPAVLVAARLGSALRRRPWGAG
jgi:Protein of unknown function (DUF2384)